MLTKAELSVTDNSKPRPGDVKVFSTRRGFADIAFGCRWSETFKEWEFLTLQPSSTRAMRRNATLFGTCVEGIRVESGAAGYKSSSLAIIANASGAGAPRTNVARSGLERTAESKELNKHIYEGVFGYLRHEIDQVRSRRRLSATGALAEGRFLLAPLLETPIDNDVFEGCIKDLPMLLIEQSGVRRTVTPAELEKEQSIWTIDCPLFSSAETLLRTAGSDASLSAIIHVLAESSFPDEPILCRGGLDDEWALGYRGVDRMILDREMTRVDLRWRVGAKDKYWKGLSADAASRVIELPHIRVFAEHQEFLRSGSLQKVFVSLGGSVEGASDEICVRSAGNFYVLQENHLFRVMQKAIDIIEESVDEDAVLASVATVMLVRTGLIGRFNQFDESMVSRYIDQGRPGLSEKVDVGEVALALNEMRAPNRMFDPTSSRRKPSSEGEEFSF